ncbi:ABC transporter substrate-binding protein [Olsenella phocaeensis]|nr:ABC transporter substrate-binding protein [Olsenella phocaeensis]
MISNFYFPPFVSMNADTGDYEGFDVDLYKAVCEKLGLEPNILPTVQFDTIVPTIKQGGKADVSLGAVTITDKRLQEIDFSDPYLDSNQAIVVKQGSAATTADALNASGTQIAVQSGTTGEAWSRENLPNATIVPLDDIIQCLTGIQTGLYAASVCDLPVASYEISSAYADLVIPDGGQIPTGEQYGIVVSKDNPKLTQAINDALVELQSDGTQDQIEQKWFGSTI